MLEKIADVEFRCAHATNEKLQLSSLIAPFQQVQPDPSLPCGKGGGEGKGEGEGMAWRGGGVCYLGRGVLTAAAGCDIWLSSMSWQVRDALAAQAK